MFCAADRLHNLAGECTSSSGAGKGSKLSLWWESIKAGGAGPNTPYRSWWLSQQPCFSAEGPSLTSSALFWRVCLENSHSEETQETSRGYATGGLREAFLRVVSYTSHQQPKEKTRKRTWQLANRHVILHSPMLTHTPLHPLRKERRE